MYVNAKYIIDKTDYDSVIIGTSTQENTSSKEASKKLGGEFINISLSGGNFKARNIILRYLLKKKKIRKIIFSVDMSSFGYFLENSQSNSYSFKEWLFLYDNNPFNNIKLYFNNKIYKMLFKMV